MRHLFLRLLSDVLFLPYYASAQEPLSPCDTATLSNGLSGSEIIDIVCPNGSLGSDSSYFIDSDSVAILLTDFPHTDYVVDQNIDGMFFCTINSDGVDHVALQILPEDYTSCRQQLIDRCSLLARKIPTLSEWGLIAMSGILGIAGLLAVRRRKAAA